MLSWHIDAQRRDRCDRRFAVNIPAFARELSLRVKCHEMHELVVMVCGANG